MAFKRHVPVNKEDPNAILYVFGDHGPYLSKSLKFDDNKTFYVQDKLVVSKRRYSKLALKKNLQTVLKRIT